ncbi:hypothetical protein SDC9_185657 [bioreactor metagenome]|uniref:Uncharacterized protein n=1 Tax=bioreactor metagenome TaxID=1076179 RepID=A0A645HRX6_9ZZZZ
MKTFGLFKIPLRQPQIMGGPVGSAEPGIKRIGKNGRIFPDHPRRPLIKTNLHIHIYIPEIGMVQPRHMFIGNGVFNAASRNHADQVFHHKRIFIGVPET